MMRETDPVGTEIDLGDSDDEDLAEDLDEDREEPQLLWKAELRDGMDEEEAVSPLVDVSDTKPLLNERDPRGVNDCLKVFHTTMHQCINTGANCKTRPHLLCSFA